MRVQPSNTIASLLMDIPPQGYRFAIIQISRRTTRCKLEVWVRIEMREIRLFQRWMTCGCGASHRTSPGRVRELKALRSR
jgi:hypothetical protein